MSLTINTFLGYTGQSRLLSDCRVALTSYTCSPVFEEWHEHENASISFLLSGTHSEDLSGKKYKRVPGDIKFIPGCELHRCNHYSADTRKINIDFNESFINRLALSEEQLVNFIPKNIDAKFTMIKLCHELNDSSASADVSAELLLYSLFDPVSSVKVLKKKPEWVSRLTELLHDEWDSPCHLDELSARLGIHPVTISRYFPLYFSSTLGTYLNQIKVDKALGLIKGTQLPLVEIAYSCGFADQAHFTRTFKAITGCLPKVFRKL